MIKYPATLPSPLQQGYNVNSSNSIIRTDMDSGPARQRRRSSGEPFILSLSWRLTQDQLALFESWYKNTLSDGSRFFTMELLAGIGLADHDVRFFSGYNAEYLGVGSWLLRAQLEILEQPLIGSDLVEFLTEVSFSDFETVVDNFHIYIHITLPTKLKP